MEVPVGEHLRLDKYDSTMVDSQRCWQLSRWKYRWVNILDLINMTPQWWIARGAGNRLDGSTVPVGEHLRLDKYDSTMVDSQRCWQLSRWKYRWVNILDLINMTPQWWIARGAGNCLRWKYRWVKNRYALGHQIGHVSIELDYFTDQCHRLDLDLEFLVVDESFLEDYLLEESLQNTMDQAVNVIHNVPESEKKAILNALKSNAKAVKAKDMTKWAVGEWLFFVEQACILKIDLTYAVDVFGSWVLFDSAETHCHQSFFGPWVFCAVWLFGCCSTWLFSRLFRGCVHLTWKGKDCSQGGVLYGWRLLIVIDLIGGGPVPLPLCSCWSGIDPMLTGSGSSIPMVVLTRLGDMAAMGHAVVRAGLVWVGILGLGVKSIKGFSIRVGFVGFIWFIGLAYTECQQDCFSGRGCDYVIWALEWSSVAFSLVNSCVKSAGDAPLFSTWYPGGSTMQLETYAYIRHGTIKCGYQRHWKFETRSWHELGFGNCKWLHVQGKMGMLRGCDGSVSNVEYQGVELHNVDNVACTTRPYMWPGAGVAWLEFVCLVRDWLPA
ncbi:hypothetical protein E3N88_26278 [Mikania micrantha]|uniref:Uncharacterized protein n=1 Tax=Mikania micrantha TaxID=192012 RepID=A0A5N6N736_9ASTR|nr:hypothetical protein E3N88_26278 [Mikania micrantha]